MLLALVAVIALAVVTGRSFGGDSAATPPVGCHWQACTGEPGVPGAPVERAEVASRVREWLDDQDIGYSMTEGHAGPGGWGWYRRDCSGFVSMALHLPDDDGGASTVGLADVVTEVKSTHLRPYDLLGRLGPETGGESGHVQFFLGWANEARTRVRVAEQGGLAERAAWPHVTTYAWPERMADGTPLLAYRYTGIRD